MKIVYLINQIGHYHDARFSAAQESFDAFHVLTVTGEGHFAEFISTETKTYPVTNLWPSKKEYESAQKNGTVQTSIDKALSTICPDVVVASGWASASSFASLRWARRHGKPIVITSESQEKDASRNFLRERIKKLLVSQFDAALVGGRTHVEYLAKLGMSKDRISLGYNAVGNGFFAERATKIRNEANRWRKQLNLPAHYFLASGRFIPKKNFPRLIEAYGVAKKNSPLCPDLIILGDGEQRTLLEEMRAQISSPSSIHLPGYKDMEEIPAYYALAECFVHVSTAEQWGLVVNEAEASGLPVIVSKQCGAASELVHNGENGYVVDAHALDEIYAALIKMASHSEDELSVMGSASRKIVAKWGPARFKRGLQEAVDSAVQHHQKRRLSVTANLLISQMLKRNIESVS